MTVISYKILSVNTRNVIGSRVRLARKTIKPPVTQSELVARLQTMGISIDQSTLSKIENGQRPVTDVEVAAFSKALKVPIGSLFEDIYSS